MPDEKTDRYEREDEDVEAHRFMTEEPGEDEAEKAKAKMKTKTRADDDIGEEFGSKTKY
jgi:hypothetical protein